MNEVIAIFVLNTFPLWNIVLFLCFHDMILMFAHMDQKHPKTNKRLQLISYCCKMLCNVSGHIQYYIT